MRQLPKGSMASALRRILVLGALLGSACAGDPNTKRDWLAARTAAPAAGARVYDRECASCHGAEGEGSRGVPELVGSGSLPLAGPRRASFRTAQDLYEYTSKRMPLPPKKAGTLRDDEYWAVVELLMRARGARIPTSGLTAATAAQIEIPR